MLPTLDWAVSVHTIALSSSGPCFRRYKRTYLNWVNSRRYSTLENCMPTVDAGPIDCQCFVFHGWTLYGKRLIPCRQLWASVSWLRCRALIWGIPESGKFFACGIRNPGLWNPEYSLRNPESHWRLESRIQVPLTNTQIQYLESGIHGVESRIPDCLRFPSLVYRYFKMEI